MNATDYLARHGETNPDWTTADYEGLENLIYLDPRTHMNPDDIEQRIAAAKAKHQPALTASADRPAINPAPAA